MVYKYFIDPLLARLRRSIKDQIAKGSTCLDIACGTGDMVFKLMDHCQSVVGIDMDEAKINAAQKLVQRKGLDHLDFRVQDATQLAGFSDNHFDYSILSMAIHQFSPELRSEILTEAKRVSKTIIVADYSCPLPKSAAGTAAKFIEYLAGKEHNRNFRHYQSSGGMQSLLDKMGLKYEHIHLKGSGVFTLFLIS